MPLSRSTNSQLNNPEASSNLSLSSSAEIKSPLLSPGKHSQKGESQKTPERLFSLCRDILKKVPQTRTTADHELLFSLTEHNHFLSGIVQKLSPECLKALLKTAKIEPIRQRQILCQEGSQISHMVVLLGGRLGICKQEDDFVIPKTVQQKGKDSRRQDKTRTLGGTLQNPGNIYEELTVLSCQEIEEVRTKNVHLKRKSSVPLTAGMLLPLPLNSQQFSQIEMEDYVEAGSEYGAEVRCKSKYHPNSVISTEKSVVLILEFSWLIHCFEHAFRIKLGETIQKVKAIPAFSFLEDSKVSECVLSMKKIIKKRNDFIYKQGERTEKLFLLLSGEIKLTKDTNLFEQNPNELYRDRRTLFSKSTDLKAEQQMRSTSFGKKKDNNEVVLPYANFTTLYNYRPIKKNIEIGIVISNKTYSLIGEQEMLTKQRRQTNAIVASFEAEYFQIDIRRLEEILGSKFLDEFYSRLQNSLRKIILYRQKEYADKVNLENRNNLDYFYFDEQNNSKDSPRKYKLQKINKKMSTNRPNENLQASMTGSNWGTFKNQKQKADSSRFNIDSVADKDSTKIEPFYTTFNFHRMIEGKKASTTKQTKTSREGSSKKSSKARSERERKSTVEDSHENIKIEYTPVQERLVGISHSWRPIKTKVGQELKVMNKISNKRHSINLYEPLIDQQYFNFVEKEQKRINREHRIFKESLGKRTK